MENKLGKKEYENILNMLKMKKQFLESCVKDYEIQAQQVEEIIKSLDQPAESKEN